MHGDEIDMLRQFGVFEPDMPWLGGRDRGLLAPERLARGVEVGREFIDLEIAAQQDFVADDHSVDAFELARRLDDTVDLALIGRLVGRYPCPCGHLEVARRREPDHGRIVGAAVGADALRGERQQIEVAGDFGLAGEGALDRALVTLKAGIGVAVNAAIRPGKVGAMVDLFPDAVLSRGDEKRQRYRYDQSEYEV